MLRHRDPSPFEPESGFAPAENHGYTEFMPLESTASKVIARPRLRVRHASLWIPLLLLVACLQMTACQTPRYKSFDGIRPGMNKSEVIETAGGPNRATRWRGLDRWVYIYEDHPGGRLIREVHFDQNTATYVGEAVKPEVSAEEQDKRNELSNLEEERKQNEFNASQDAKLGRARPAPMGMGYNGNKGSFPAADYYDEYIEEGLYGTTPAQEKCKRAPVFRPVE